MPFEVDNTGERDHMPQGRLMCGQAQRQLPARRMSHHYQAVRVDMKPGRFLLHEPAGGADIGKRAWPSTARIADAPIFDIERCQTRRAQSFAEMPSMGQVVLCTPISTMDVEQAGVQPLRVGATAPR